MTDKSAKFGIGAIVKHRLYPFRGVVVDVDPEFDNTDEWYEAIPAELRPDKAQPFYHLLAENSDSYYTAYVSQQNLIPDWENGPIGHPDVDEMFDGYYNDPNVLSMIEKKFGLETRKHVKDMASVPLKRRILEPGNEKQI